MRARSLAVAASTLGVVGAAISWYVVFVLRWLAEVTPAVVADPDLPHGAMVTLAYAIPLVVVIGSVIAASVDVPSFRSSHAACLFAWLVLGSWLLVQPVRLVLVFDHPLLFGDIAMVRSEFWANAPLLAGFAYGLGYLTSAAASCLSIWSLVRSVCRLRFTHGGAGGA